MELNECCHKTKHRDAEEKKKLINRLNRIEGQIRGIKNMVQNDGYCADILVQTSAASSALGSFSKILLTEHIKSCVADDIRNGNNDTIEELTELLRKMMK